MKPILSIAATAALAAAIAAAPITSSATTPSPKAHAATTVHKAKVTTTTVNDARDNPCADPQTAWPAGNASARQTQATSTPQFRCNGLRTVLGEDAATEADMRPAMSAKAAAAADVDDYIGMGNTVPPERK